jgi:hypothetical protein
MSKIYLTEKQKHRRNDVVLMFIDRVHQLSERNILSHDKPRHCRSYESAEVANDESDFGVLELLPVDSDFDSFLTKKTHHQETQENSDCRNEVDP